MDGIIISSASFDEEYVQQLIDSGVPVVLLMSREYAGIDSRAGRIDTGLYEGMRECVEFLVRKGRRNLLYIDRISKHGRFSTMEDLRYRAFCEQMRESGLELTNESIVTGCSTEQELFDLVCRKIKSGMPVDGIVGRNDNMACVAMRAALACGRRIPQDISVIGFDNSRMSAYVTPALTSMEIDRATVAAAIINMLDAMIRGEDAGEQYVRTRLVEREST